VLELDHIVPVSRGGLTEETNLVTACVDCNAGKTDKLLTDVPRPIEAALTEQVERREQLEEYNRYLLAARKREQELAREIGVYWCDLIYGDSEAGKWICSNARLRSIGIFIKRLPATDVFEAMDRAVGKLQPSPNRDENAWKYFCGICWKNIRKREAPSETA